MLVGTFSKYCEYQYMYIFRNVKIYSYRRVEQSPAIEEAPGQGPDDRGLEEAEPVQGGEHQVCVVRSWVDSKLLGALSYCLCMCNVYTECNYWHSELYLVFTFCSNSR